MACAYVVVLYLYFEAYISDAFSFYSSNIWLAFGARMYLLDPKGGGGGRTVGLSYCLILSAFVANLYTNCCQKGAGKK
jgi:hypothetical protein